MQGGVQRVHLLDGTISGVLLLELFKRDGMGTMVARYVLFAILSDEFYLQQLHSMPSADLFIGHTILHQACP